MTKIIKTVVVVSIIIVAATILYWQKNKPVVDGKIVIKKSFVFNQNKFYIEQYQDEKTKSFLVRRNWLSWPDSFELSGFEDDIMLCNENIFSQNIASSICLIGYVGAHSQNMQFVRIDDANFSSIIITRENGEKSEHLISDSPSFTAAKEGNQSFLYVDQRDYNANPLNSIIRDVYIYKDGQIIFDKKTGLQYTSN